MGGRCAVYCQFRCQRLRFFETITAHFSASKNDNGKVYFALCKGGACAMDVWG